MSTKHARRQFSLRLGMTSLLLLSAVAVGSVNIAFAGGPNLVPGTPLPGTPGFIMTFDENGHATINGQSIPSSVLGGGGVSYLLPGPVTPGDVNVFAAGDIGPNNANGFSDILHFLQNGPTGGELLYFSLLDDNGPPDLADTGILGPANTPFSVMETGPEGNNGFQWIATDSSTGATASYNGISDTPEPSTFILGGLGLIALFLIGRRRKR
jgi:hypothetical protein